MLSKFLLPLVFLVAPCATMASTVNINLESGGVQYLSQHGIRDNTATFGRDLTGMIVTASYVDGTTEAVTWGATRGAFGQSVGSGFSLVFGWSEFALSMTKSLASLSLDSRTGNAVFDTSRSTRPGDDTYGTKGGYPFEISGDYDPDGMIDVTYSQGFIVAGYERAPDTYTRMSIDFRGLEGGGLSSALQFRTDLDSLAVAGDLSSVPLPASLLMFASAFGVLGAGAVRKRAVR